MLRHYDRATHHYFVPGTNTFRNMCDLLAGMKANLTPGRKGAVAQRGLRPRGLCDFASRSGSQGGCMWMNVDGVAEKGEFMWVKIHLHPRSCRFIHVYPHKKFISGMSQRATILGCFCVLQRISACLAYFSLNIFSEPMNNKGTKTRRNSFNRRKRSEQSSTAWSLLPSVEVRCNSQLIPTYSSLFQHIYFSDRCG